MTIDLNLIVQFAVRPTLRNHNVLTRETIIRQTAAAVGAGHKVDLKGYDALIIVEAYTASVYLNAR